MNLLLLLSALLSALGGVGQAVRGGGRTEAVCAVALAAKAVPVRRAVAATRPATPLPRVAALPAIRGLALALAPSAPLYAQRRRE